MAEVITPNDCPLCGKYMGPHGDDVHMILQHPETRQKPEQRPGEVKKKGKRKS